MHSTKFIKNVGLVGIASIFFTLPGFLLVPILTKLLGAYQYGIWIQIFAAVTILASVATLGFDRATLRYLSSLKSKKVISTKFYTALFIVMFTATIFTVILFISANVLAEFVIKDITVANYIKLAAPLIVIFAVNLLVKSFLEAFQEFKNYAYLAIFLGIGEVVAVLTTLFLGYALWGVIASIIVVHFLYVVAAFLIIRYQLSFSLPNYASIHKYIKFSLPLIPLPIFMWIVHSSDIYIIGFFQGATSVGIYSSVYSLSKIMFFLMAPLSTVLLPVVYKAFDKKNLTETRDYLAYSLKYFLLLAIPAGFGLFALSKPILLLLTTPEFVIGANLFLPLAFGLVMYKLSAFFTLVLNMYERTKFVGQVFGISTVFNVVMNFIAIPRWGLNGAALSTFLTYLLLLVSMFYYSRRFFKFKLHFGFFIKSIFASFSMIFILGFWKITNIYELVLTGIIGCGIYFVIIVALKGVTKQEINMFRNLIKYRNN